MSALAMGPKLVTLSPKELSSFVVSDVVAMFDASLPVSSGAVFQCSASFNIAQPHLSRLTQRGSSGGLGCGLRRE